MSTHIIHMPKHNMLMLSFGNPHSNYLLFHETANNYMFLLGFLLLYALNKKFLLPNSIAHVPLWFENIGFGGPLHSSRSACSIINKP